MCHCLGVTRDQLDQAVIDQDLTCIRDVMHCTGAGSGCTACHARIREYLLVRAIQLGTIAAA